MDLGTDVELKRPRVIDAPGVTHLRFRLIKGGAEDAST